MTFKDDLFAASKKIFTDLWTTTDKRVVPSPSDLGLGNDAGHFEEMTVLYADMDGSTKMVDANPWWFSAEVYKAYLHCAAKIVKAEGGVITAYDGDRIMAVFTGDSKNANAATAALKINAAVNQVINSALSSAYPAQTFRVNHSIGIDTSKIHVARIGVRGEGDNDLVWVGRAANHAAKLTTLATGVHRLWITEDVYRRIPENLKTLQAGGAAWQAYQWSDMNNATVYASHAWHPID
jgi:class 3 adenylate cyclase